MYGDLPPTKILLTDVVFTHQDLDGTQTSWNVSQVDRDLKPLIEAGKIKIEMIPLEPWFVELCFTGRGLEQHRLDRLTDEALESPTYWVHMKDDTHLLIDGTHRYAYAGLTGKEFIKGVVLPEEIEQRARIEVPQIEDFDAYKSSFSGLL